jgi:hypothetical protein
MGFEPFSLDGCHQIELLIVDRKSDLRKLAEVVGSNPIRSISFILVNYGIELSLFSVVVGQKPCHNTTDGSF